MFLELLAALLCVGDATSPQKKSQSQKRDSFIWDGACDNCGETFSKHSEKNSIKNNF